MPIPAAPDRVGLPHHPRGPARRQGLGNPPAGQVPKDPRHPRGAARSDGSSIEPGECEVPDHPRRPRGDDRTTSLAVRMEVRLLTGEAGRALAAAQGRALAALGASVGEVEVEGGEEVSP